MQLGNVLHPPRDLLPHPFGHPQAAWPRPLSLPLGNASTLPIKYWSPAIFVVVALLVLFFTYRWTKGEGEGPIGPRLPPVCSAARWVGRKR